MPRTCVWFTMLVVALTLLTSSCREQTKEEAMAEGSKLVGEGNAKGAAVIYKTLLEQYPEDDQAHFELANAYLEMGKPDQAEKEAQRLATIPNPPERLQLLLGKIHIAQGKMEQALEELSAYLAKTPDSAEAWEFVGLAQARNKDLPKAVDAYQHALSLDPERIMARIGLIETMLAQGQLEEARGQVDTLLAAKPKHQAGLHLLAQIQGRNNDIPAAIATYGEIVAKYPNDVRARYNEALLRLETQGASEKIEQAAKRLIKDFPNLPEGYKLQGLLDIRQGASEQAVTNLQQALHLRPEIETHYFLAQAYERNGNMEMATSELRVVLDNRPQHVRARQMLASLHLRMNRAEEATGELEKLLKFAPDDSSSKLMLGDIYLARKDFGKSLDVFNTIPEDMEQSAMVHLRKGVIMAVTGKMQQAEAELREAVRKAPDNLEARVNLAVLLKGQQRQDEAMAILELEGLSAANAAQARTVQATLRIQEGREEDAMALLEKAKELDPNLASSYFALAKIYSQKLEPDKALDQYRQLLVHQPQSPAAHLAFAAGLESAGKYEEAQQHLEQAAESKQIGAYLELAGFLSRRDKNDAALKVLDLCLQENAKALPVLVSMARLQLEAGNEAKSLAAIKDIEAINPALALSERLRLELSLRRFDQAETVASKIIDLNPASADSYLSLALVKTQQGDLPGAERVLHQALDADNANTNVRLELGSLLMRMGRLQEAATAFDEALARVANPAVVYASRGLAWQTYGDIDAAIRDYEAALRLQNNIPMVLNNLAMIYADKPSLAGKGLEYAWAAKALANNNPLVLDTLGYALLKNGRPQDATCVLQQAAALAPKNRDIVQHLKMADSSQK